MNLEAQLKRIEAKMDLILKLNSPTWITEEEAMKRMGRSKVWFKKQRLGVGNIPATLIEGVDWRKINGRTPEYKATSIERRKHFVTTKQIEHAEEENGGPCVNTIC